LNFQITLFISHNAYTQAMWLWVLMSSMRYMATHRPLAYHSWRISHMAIGAILLFSFVLSSWLLFGHYHDITVQGHCVLVYDVRFFGNL
jgi:hypothetical protein